MLRIYRLIAILAFLIMAILVSGCYTMVGHPTPVEEGVIKEDLSEGRSFGYYESPYGRSYPYYDSYYGLDSYYSSWYPGSYYYGGYGGYGGYYGGYGGYYGGYGGYGNYYGDYYLAPEKRPATRRRGATEFRRPSRTEDRIGPRLERNDGGEQSERRVPNRRRVEKRTQRSSEQRRSAPSERRRSRER